MDLPEVQIVGGIVRVYSGSFHLSLRTHKIVRRKHFASLLTAKKKKKYIYIYIYRRFNAIVSQLRFLSFWVMFLNLWLKVIHIEARQNMNWYLVDNFEATNLTFLPKKLSSNVQSSCIDNSNWPKSELWHYCIKATIYIVQKLKRISWAHDFIESSETMHDE